MTRKRCTLALRPISDSAVLRLVLGAAQVLGQLSDGRKLKHRDDRQILLHDVSEIPVNLNHEQRLSAEIKEVLVGADVVQAKRLFPDCSNLESPVQVSAAKGVACGAALS